MRTVRVSSYNQSMLEKAPPISSHSFFLSNNNLQDSFFYEHFYADIEAWVHYIPFNHNLNNLIQRINWASDNDHLAHIISENARHYVRTELEPADVYCYAFRLLSTYAEKQYGDIEVREGMRELSTKRPCGKCPYNLINKGEL